jgi:sulfite reductase alpha subunit-like flavoprotein
VLTGAQGKNVLYFGCRSRKADYLYGDELGTYPLLFVCCALLCFFLRTQFACVVL